MSFSNSSRVALPIPQPGTLRQRISDLSQRRWIRVTVLVGLVVLLELVMFRSYFSGSTIPPWDFLGSYNTDAYLWWEEGSFFSPPSWIPNVWAGYPAALNLQNSAWYLPVGIASLFGPFTLHISAIVAALHVAMGFFGTFFLVRSFRYSYSISIVIATASFFGVGYFSNAQHVDIARGYALIPWILLVISPTWGWRRPWGIPLAIVILWQAVTGMYPGMVVATAYVAILWVVVYQLQSRNKVRNYLLPLVVAAVGALFLSAPRLLPYFLTQESAGPPFPDGSVFSLAMVGTLLFGYTPASLPNDVSMRSFFIPATMLLLAFFARWCSSATKQALAIGVPAVILGLPFFPWFDAAQSLPGLDLSRFTMSDFKVFMILAVLLLAASGLDSLLRLKVHDALPRRVWFSLGGSVAFCVAMALVGKFGPFLRSDWFPQTVVLGVSFAVIVAFIVIRQTGKLRQAGGYLFVASLVMLTALSGIVWAFTTTVTWKAPRVEAEIAAYGDTVSNMLANRSEDLGSLQRPPRLALDPGYELQDLRDVRWNRAYFTGEYSVGGYLNLKGSLTPAQLEGALLDEEMGAGVMSFLAAPGVAFTSADGAAPSAEELKQCGESGSCGESVLLPAGYSPGHLVYDVSTEKTVTALFNEAYYPGWTATMCKEEACEAIEVDRSSLGLLETELPAGDYKLSLDYQTPGRTAGWVVFGLGLSIAVASSAAVAWSVRRKRE